MSLPGNPFLPPGCTDAMIDRHAQGPEDCAACDGTGELNKSDCCAAPLFDDYQDNLTCPACGGSCERQTCAQCRGSGAIPAPDPTVTRAQALEDKADDK